MDLILRSEKSSPLTFAEMDSNLQKIQDEFNGLAAANSTVSIAGVPAYLIGLLTRSLRTLSSFGAKGDGVTDDRESILAANAEGLPILIEKPSAFYKVNQETIITCPVFIGKYKVFEPSNYIRFDVGTVQEIYPEWWGAKAEYDATLTQYNSTAAIQSAIRATKTMFSASSINVGVLHAIPVVLGVGVYYTTDLVIEKQCILKGQGRFNTLVKALNNNLDMVRINTPYPVEIYGISFGVKDGIGALVAGTIIKIELDSGHNEYTRIVGCSFNNMHYGIFCVDAGFIEIASCYFNANSNAAIVIGNASLPDNGDSQITGCTFNNGTGASIVQLSGGGLRITNNKFLGGTYNYYGNFSSGNVNRTGQLIISDNSFDFCTVANIRLSKTGDTPFSLVNILDNIIVTGPSCTGVLVDGFAGETFISDLSIGGNQFYLRNGAAAIHLASLRQATIYPNHYKCDAPEVATGIIFANFPLSSVEIHPQSFYGSITRYTGSQDSANFVVGFPIKGAGSPINSIGADYIGQEYLDTTANQWYKSKGLTGTDWILLG